MDRKRLGARGWLAQWTIERTLLLCLGILLFSPGAGPTFAQSPFPNSAQQDTPLGTAQQQKIDDLARLCADADVRAWLETHDERGAAPVACAYAMLHGTATVSSFVRDVTLWADQARARLQTIFSKIPYICDEIWLAILRLSADATANRHAPAMALPLIFLSGATFEELFRRRWLQSKKGLADYLPTIGFAGITAAFLFALDSPPLIRLVTGCYVLAFVVYRLAATGTRHAAHPYARRLQTIMALALFATATTVAGTILDRDWDTLQALDFLISLIILGMAIELAWHRRGPTVAGKTALSLHLASVWVLWCLDLKTLFWLGVYLVVLPSMMRSLGHLVRDYTALHTSIVPPDSRDILLVRGARATLVGLAIGWIALVWDLDDHMVGHGNPQMASVFYGVLKCTVVVLLADLVWHLAKAAIDRHATRAVVPASIDAEPGGPAPEAHATRLHTLLPILRNVLAVALIGITGLVILGQLGVDIAPLIAGAGILGVAIGFGSQALVRDVISGVFYLFDDAFRVGEYIQAKTYKGTVEGFSLRSVKLRHHRGPLFTVPFGELGAVENMSRDWSKVKFSITVPYDTDIEKARKIGKAIGKELLDDPELGPLFIQPLKMKGVEEFGEYGIVISFAMVTVPTGQQSFIRRSAHAMLRKAFKENGIAFAQPTVRVGAGEEQETVAAAYQSRQLKAVSDRQDPANS